MPPKKRATQEQVVKEVESQSSPPPPDYRKEGLFIQLNPPKFNGEGDPAEAEDWVRSMERIFKFLHITEEEMLRFATFQLNGSADYWWEARTKFMNSTELENYTWKEFKAELFGKYVPKSYLRKKEDEFYMLRQEMMSVADYDRLFCALSRYAPQLVDTDEKMAKRFCAGLRPEIGVFLAGRGGLSYAESYSRALSIEAAKSDENASPVTAIIMGSTHTQTYSFEQKRKGKGNFHGAENAICFACGKKGHYASQCLNS